MASLRTRNRRGGSIYLGVLYRFNGKQISTSFHDYVSAARFHDLVDKIGPAKALEATVGTDPGLSAMRVAEWLQHHIFHLTGLQRAKEPVLRATNLPSLRTERKSKAHRRHSLVMPSGIGHPRDQIPNRLCRPTSLHL